MKGPMPEFVDVTEGDDDVSPPPSDDDASKGKKKDGSDSGKNGSSKQSSKDPAKEAKKADESVKKITVESDTGETISLSTGKRKVKKKKK
jgi:hypothetical protein